MDQSPGPDRTAPIGLVNPNHSFCLSLKSSRFTSRPYSREQCDLRQILTQTKRDTTGRREVESENRAFNRD